MKARFAVALLSAALLAGCEPISYYSQAIRGHFEMMAAARPLDDWLADDATPGELRAKLETARRIREFASKELGLPENRSYASYAQLNRPFVGWNVSATPEFSVQPRKDCFPITGCVSYRGFFAEAHAREHAARLRAAGYDVYVGGVPAYSTLGWFDDPLLSTFIHYSDSQLARLVFHELAHQLLYARDDTTFNESFAVAVEEEGVRRWLAAEGRLEELAAFHAAQARKREFATKVAQTRSRLAEIYRLPLPQEELRVRKRDEWEQLRARYPKLPAEPNNALLASVAIYTALVPEFERLLADAGGDLKRFYETVRVLAASERSNRGPLSAQSR
jgi:predicted aminopeptidase